ncbi:MAG: glutamine amidotransferase family protein [Anaerolineae bacterium]|jgi:glutamate synthase domain-containing protein 1
MNGVSYENRYGDDKVFDACGLFGIMDVTGQCFSAHDVVAGISNMEERGNGLGGGFAVYGCYPQYADCYAFHVMYTEPDSRAQVEAFMRANFILVHDEQVPHQPTSGLDDAPLIWRYFVQVDESAEGYSLQGEAEYVVSKVMELNTAGQGAYIYSSGKNVGVFKGAGFPAQIAEYFELEAYEGYIWTAHARFPTNTPGWWGGAHPFSILDWTVVHNGEISSYGANRRYLEMCGYHCTMHTDTEVIAYAADLLMRRHSLPVEIASKVMAPPLWVEIDRMPPEKQALYRTLRQAYGGMLVNGPFTVIIARQGEMIGLPDRIRLRPLTAATGGNRLYLSSEEASIRLVCPQLERVWTPMGGEPVVGRLGMQFQAEEAPALQIETLGMMKAPAMALAA